MEHKKGDKVWIQDTWGIPPMLVSGTLMHRYFLDGDTEPYWKVRTTRKASAFHWRSIPENKLYPSREIAKAAIRLGI